MKNLIALLIITSCCLQTINAQLGFRAKYNINDFKETSKALENFFGEETILDSGFGLGIDYWFRLEKRRVEFMPEVYYTMNKSTFNNDFITSVQLNRIGLNFNTHIYPLDFGEDCNCPTFSKDGPSISKGFFFHISPGVSYNLMNMTSTAGSVNDNNDISIKVGGGVGIDIGINDLLTITPIYTYNYFIAGDWTFTNFPNGEEPIVIVSSNSTQHQFGLRVGLRFDY